MFTECPNFAELIFQHVDDSETWCRLAQVNKKFNKASKTQLTPGKICTSEETIVWTTLPNRKEHGPYRRFYVGGQLRTETYFRDGRGHGVSREWHHNGRLFSKSVFKNGWSVSHSAWDSSGLQIIGPAGPAGPIENENI